MMWKIAYTIAIYALLQRMQMTRRERAIQGEFDLVLDSSYMSKMIAYYLIAHAIRDEDSKFLGAKAQMNYSRHLRRTTSLKQANVFPRFIMIKGNFMMITQDSQDSERMK